MLFRRIATTISMLSLLLLTAAANADLIRITPTGVASDEQLVTSPVPIGADGFRTTFHGGGSKTILDPILLILANPTSSPLSIPTLNHSLSNPDVSSDIVIRTDSGGIYGGSWNSDGFGGTYDQNTSKDAAGGNISVYEFLGFTPDGSDSQNYPNWTGATNTTSWDLWVFEVYLDPQAFDKGEWIEFAMTNMPVDSYVIGYGCTGLNNLQDACGNEGSTQSTPFTFAGRVSVPEPGSLALLGGGLLLTGLLRRRRRV